MRLSFAVVVSASGTEFGGAPGAPLGQRGRGRCPAAGCQADVSANKLAEPPTRVARISRRMRMIGTFGFAFTAMIAASGGLTQGRSEERRVRKEGRSQCA